MRGHLTNLLGENYASTLGLGALGVGVLDNMNKRRKAHFFADHAENNFAYKNSVMNLAGKEINTLQFANKQL